MTRPYLLFAVVVASLAVSGCGTEPLVGTWRNTLTVLGQPLVSDWTFHADHTLDASTSFTYAADAPTNGGCTETHAARGAGWSTTASDGGTTMTLTITQPSTIVNTVARTGCAHPADNLAESPENTSAMGMSSSQAYTYGISGNMLTLTPTSIGMPADSTTFTRVMSL